MVINLMREMVALSVISQPTELSAIVKIPKYKRLHEGQHFNPMAMEVHDTLEHDMDHLIKSVPIFSTIDD
jgi:hypothetical protein